MKHKDRTSGRRADPGEMVIGKVHDGFSHEIENKVLGKLAPYAARYMNADVLSCVALLGAVVAGSGLVAAGKDLVNLWWLPAGLALHWLGDGLDGKVAGIRKESRPHYGYYLDRIFDVISVTIILVSVQISVLTNTNWWLYVLIVSLMLGSHLFLKAGVTGMFDMQIGRFGGLEAKALGLLLLVGVWVTKNRGTELLGMEYTFLDIAGLVLIVVTGSAFVGVVVKSLVGKNRIRD